ncbi:MAG: polysaccharide lyase [Gammaproteobacteria bacterium]
MSPRRIATLVIALAAAAWFAAGLAHRLYNRAGPGDLDFAVDFEQLDDEPWTVPGATHVCCDDSLIIVDAPVRSGRHAARFHLRRDDDDVKGSRRAEVRAKAGDLGRDYWFAFSINLPADWPDASVPVTLAQWHGVPDKWLGEAGRSPPLRLLALGGQWQLANIWDSKRVSQTPFTANDPQGWVLEPISSLDIDQWTDWLFHVRWSFGEDGVLEVWKNGERVYQRNGPNTYNDAVGPYLKLGIYVPEWVDPATVTTRNDYTAYFDAVRVAESPLDPDTVAEAPAAIAEPTR